MLIPHFPDDFLLFDGIMKICISSCESIWVFVILLDCKLWVWKSFGLSFLNGLVSVKFWTDWWNCILSFIQICNWKQCPFLVYVTFDNWFLIKENTSSVNGAVLADKEYSIIIKLQNNKMNFIMYTQKWEIPGNSKVFTFSQKILKLHSAEIFCINICFTNIVKTLYKVIGMFYVNLYWANISHNNRFHKTHWWLSD